MGDGSLAKPFALQEQYVKAVKAKKAEEAAKGCESESENDDEEHEKKKTTKNPKSKNDQVESSWKYNAIRKAFIEEAKKQHKVGFQKAKEMWDSSQQKRELLAPLTVAELRRRKFIAKECTENPWAAKVVQKE